MRKNFPVGNADTPTGFFCLWAEVLGSKLSEWQPVEDFFEGITKMGKNGVFFLKSLLLNIFARQKFFPDRPNVKALVLTIPKMWYFLGAGAF